MKVTFSKKELLSALVPAAGISQVKNTYLSCDGLLFECPPDKRFGDYDTDSPSLCRISAFDFEKGLRTTIRCTIHEPGMFLLNTQSVLQIIRALPEGEISIEIDRNGAAVISGGKVNFRMSAGPGENFPTMPMFIGTDTCKIPQSALRRVLSETVFAIAQNDLQRTGFTGGLFRIRDGELTVTGCDNHRLALSRCSVSGMSGSNVEACFILPGKFLGELLRLLGESEDEVIMITGRKHVFFKIQNLWFFTRILDTDYPEYEKMLPAFYRTEAVVSRAELLDAAERASIVAEAKLGGIGGAYVKLEFAENELIISSVASGGAVDETLSPVTSGAELAIGFECRNLLETLRACPVSSERLRLRLNTSLLGMLIEPDGGSSFLNTCPDPSIYGENIPGSMKSSVLMPEETADFLYFVLPTRMNVSVK